MFAAVSTSQNAGIPSFSYIDRRILWVFRPYNVLPTRWFFPVLRFALLAHIESFLTKKGCLSYRADESLIDVREIYG